eukprot:2139674-Prymnesium_polylepis.1
MLSVRDEPRRASTMLEVQQRPQARSMWCREQASMLVVQRLRSLLLPRSTVGMTSPHDSLPATL